MRERSTEGPRPGDKIHGGTYRGRVRVPRIPEYQFGDLVVSAPAGPYLGVEGIEATDSLLVLLTQEVEEGDLVIVKAGKNEDILAGLFHISDTFTVELEVEYGEAAYLLRPEEITIVGRCVRVLRDGELLADLPGVRPIREVSAAEETIH